MGLRSIPLAWNRGQGMLGSPLRRARIALATTSRRSASPRVLPRPLVQREAQPEGRPLASGSSPSPASAILPKRSSKSPPRRGSIRSGRGPVHYEDTPRDRLPQVGGSRARPPVFPREKRRIRPTSLGLGRGRVRVCPVRRIPGSSRLGRTGSFRFESPLLPGAPSHSAPT